MIPKTERLSADVLILGGGLAGCMGAVAAIKKGCTVILADKAWVGSSGESTFAAGDILYYDPEQDDMHEWLERGRQHVRSRMAGMVRQERTRADPDARLMGHGVRKRRTGTLQAQAGTRPPRSRGLPRLQNAEEAPRHPRKARRGHRRPRDDHGTPDLGRPCGRGYGLQCPHGPVLCVRSEEYGPFHGRV